MTRLELIKYVEEELSLACALTINLPAKNINRIIDQSKKWFYENYQYSVESKFYILPQPIFTVPEFRANRSIYFGECVVSVVDVREQGGIGFSLGGNIDRDFNGNKLIASEVYLAPMGGDGLVFQTAYQAFADLAKAFTIQTIAYDFNKNTRKLTFKGRDPRTSVMVSTYNKIDEQYLFDDNLFIDYVTAQSKIQLSRMLGFFQYNLPGGITINYDMLKSEGTDLLTEIKETIDSQNPPDWFITWH